ncbi:hypothetical protein Baya_14549 [Bagarius yarrelli]|uniref:Uncharacterized protein n=1 Tax=Bagarius yarrelli TaxID=175774 RepID=A0A556V9Q4_BAGYA|nr:hypothetical protein Baya_14549 [Bagarius yarrelli]
MAIPQKSNNNTTEEPHQYHRRATAIPQKNLSNITVEQQQYHNVPQSVWGDSESRNYAALLWFLTDGDISGTADVFLPANEEAAQMIMNVCGVMELSGCENERETEEYARSGEGALITDEDAKLHHLHHRAAHPICSPIFSFTEPLRNKPPRFPLAPEAFQSDSL